MADQNQILQSLVDNVRGCIAAALVDIGELKYRAVAKRDGVKIAMTAEIAKSAAELLVNDGVRNLDAHLDDNSDESTINEMLLFRKSSVVYVIRSRTYEGQAYLVLFDDPAKLGLILAKCRQLRDRMDAADLVDSFVDADKGVESGRADTRSTRSSIDDTKDSKFGSRPDCAWTYHWAVTLAIDSLGRGTSSVEMDQTVDLSGSSILRDVVIHHQPYLGRYPRRGLHEMFLSEGGYKSWRWTYAEKMHNHLLEVARDVQRMYVGPAPLTPTYAIISFESWRLVWERTRNTPSEDASPEALDYDFRSDWQECVAAINTPWNLDFLNMIDFVPPAGTRGFGDLAGTDRVQYEVAREELMKLSWEYFAREFFLLTLEACRLQRPELKWAFAGYPATPYLGYTRDQADDHRNWNDSLAWLFDVTDFIAPRFIPLGYAVEHDEPDLQRAEVTVEQDRGNIESCINEALRIRHQYASGKPVLSIHSYRYPSRMRHYSRQMLNAINMHHQFWLPGELGVDGMVVMGHINSVGERDVIQSIVDGKF